MKAIEFMIKFLVAVIISLFLNACSDSNEKESFDAFTDVFVIKKKVDGVEKTANAYYVYANNTVASAKVIPPENSSNQVELTAINQQSFDYHHEPDTSEYSLTPPSYGSYVFEIESTEGETIQRTDLLTAVNLTIPEITSTTYNTSTLSLTVKWNKVTGTDGIFVKLLNKEGEIVYISYALANSVSEYHIGIGGGNWKASADNGDELVLQIQSVIIEDDADESYSLYNIEGTAIAEKTIIWGE